MPYLIQQYSHEKYGAHTQNWVVTQDSRGVIYVGNSSGVLEYDGSEWRLIETSASVPHPSLTLGNDGRVYVGLIGDVGYLSPDSIGMMQFVSLRDKIPPAHQNSSDVFWAAHATSDGVYFQTHQRILKWDGERMSVWSFASQVHTSFVVNDVLYFRQQGVGLLRATSNAFVLLPGGEAFAEEPVFALLPFEGDKLLIGTRNKGLFTHDGTTLTAFPTEVEEYLLENKLYHGCQLADGTYAFATRLGGVVVADQEGKVLSIIDESVGLLDQVALFVFSDREGGLWIALNNGITRVDALSPVSIFDRRAGLGGSIRHMQRHEGRLYVATSRGVFQLRETAESYAMTSRRASLEIVDGLSSSAWSLLSTESGLLVATDDGVYNLNSGKLENIMPGRSYALVRSSQDHNKVYVGLAEGLAVLEVGANSVRTAGRVSGISEEIWSLYEDKNGTLWLGTSFRGLLKVETRHHGEVVVERFDTSNGLPVNNVIVSRIGENVALFAPTGIYRIGFEDGKTKFYPDPYLKGRFEGRTINSLTIAEDTTNGNVWLAHDGTVEVAVRQEAAHYKIRSLPTLHFPEMKIASMLTDMDGVVWLGSEDRLIRFDSNVQPYEVKDFPALIRSVVMNGDSLLYGGAFYDKNGHVVPEQPSWSVPVLYHYENALRIGYAATSYSTESDNTKSAILFQYFLEGFEKDWSGWTRETRKDYTNLPAGDYRFRVRAQNRFGFISEEAVYGFSILPPWYQTWWAYGLYFATLVSVILAYGRYRTVVHAAEMGRELAKERLVNERLQQANDLLQEADRLKDEFLANTSHELRTPLAAILGFASVLREEVSDEHREFVDLIDESGQRLLHTLNSLLDLAKLRANMIDVKPEVLDVVKETRAAARLLKPLAQKKNLYLRVETSDPQVHALLDRVCLERILNNLIGNAIKFTESGGVTIRISATGTHAILEVQDTGVGINHDFLPFLFDEFRQQSTGLARSHEGSGLGLSITKRMVDLMNGTISVESEEGSGSSFVVAFSMAATDGNGGGDGEALSMEAVADTSLDLAETDDRPEEV